MPETENTDETPKKKIVQEESLFSWTEKSRPFERRSRDFYISLLSVAVLFGLLLFVIEGIMPVMLEASLVFLFYVLSTHEPEQIPYEVTNKGIRMASKLTEWSKMGRFWFTDRLNHRLLVIETSVIPGRLELVVNSDIEGKLEKILEEYLVNEEVPPSFFDKAASWASKRLPQK
jgi:hypothetical protein